MKRLLAIDPGASGGMAWNDADGVAQSGSMPATEGDIVDSLRAMRLIGIHEIIIEQVGGYIRGNGAPGSTMFNFGRGVGVIHGAAMALGFRIETVTPQKWQKHFQLGTAKSCASKTEWKNKLKAKAQQLFPHATVTLKTADALLLWEYGQKAGV
jgi:hypothetical protein